MRVEYINPFISATVNLFKSMVNTEVERQTPYLREEPMSRSEVSAVIGISGKVQGTVVLQLDRKMAIEAVARFLCDPECAKKTEVDAEVADGIGELVNIIAGSAKAELSNGGFNLSLSIPSVVVGNGHDLYKNQEVPTVVIPFKTGLGSFAVEVSLHEAKVHA